MKYIILTILLIFSTVRSVPSSTPQPAPQPTSQPLLQAHVIPNGYQVFQTFNNCGPASLSMLLSYFDIHVSQKELGDSLRPYQNPQGDNDDKSVTLDELAQKAESYGFIAYHRPAGSIELLKQFLAHDIPIITITLLKKEDDIGHYRIIKGYDDVTQELIQDDSMEGKNIHYSFQEFISLWSIFNNEYLVIAPKEKQATLERILGEDIDPQVSWKKIIKQAQHTRLIDPQNVQAGLALSVSSYMTGQYQQSVDAYEQVASKLPLRTLWYQIEPIKAYMELGNYDKVISLTDTILTHGNRAYSELYLIRGDVYTRKGDSVHAMAEYEQALKYNEHLEEARKKIRSLQP